MNSPRVYHIRPAAGGLAEYGKQIEAIYRQQHYELEVLEVGPQTDLTALAAKLQSISGLCHFEIGAGDGALFRLSRQLLRRSPVHQFVTLHDPGVVVRHPLPVTAADSAHKSVRILGKLGRKAAGETLGKSLIKQWLGNPHLIKLYLRPDLASDATSYYLPQPTYHEQLPAPRRSSRQPSLIGFGGYWGPGKGLETLIEAWQSLNQANLGLKLVIAGSGASARDPHDLRLRTQIQRLPQPPELPGYIPDEQLDAFLAGLSALVLPYWPSLPSGTSAMALRAAELGTPIIASDTPALRGQLGAQGAVYVQPQDARSLAGGIERLVADWTAIETRAKDTQTAIFRDHNWQIVGQSLTEIITKVGPAS